MKKLIISIFLFALFSYAFATPAQELSAELSKFKTYHANFSQVTKDSNGRVIQQSSGQMWLMPPGRFKWQADKPTHQSIITNGKYLWVYDADLQQATQQVLNNKAHVNPVSILSGSISDIQTNFIVFPSSPGVFILKPKNQNLDFKQIKLVFVNAKITKMEVINNLDETTDFDFANIQINQPLRADFFELNVPKDVDILKE